MGLCNSATSVFAGIVVFAILGNLAGGKDISQVVTVRSLLLKTLNANAQFHLSIIAINRIGICGLPRSYH